nr:hypothetical protein [Tanacetum cinerariifolium]
LDEKGDEPHVRVRLQTKVNVNAPFHEGKDLHVRTRLTLASLEMCMRLKDHLDAQERKQDKFTLETRVDFEEEILDADVQENEAISLSDEEIALDAASIEGFMSRPGSRGEEDDYGYDDMMNYHDDY